MISFYPITDYPITRSPDHPIENLGFALVFKPHGRRDCVCEADVGW